MSLNRGIFEVINEVDRDYQDKSEVDHLSLDSYQSHLDNLRNFLLLNHATELSSIL